MYGHPNGPYEILTLKDYFAFTTRNLHVGDLEKMKKLIKSNLFSEYYKGTIIIRSVCVVESQIPIPHS